MEEQLNLDLNPTLIPNREIGADFQSDEWRVQYLKLPPQFSNTELTIENAANSFAEQLDIKDQMELVQTDPQKPEIGLALMEPFNPDHFQLILNTGIYTKPPSQQIRIIAHELGHFKCYQKIEQAESVNGREPYVLLAEIPKFQELIKQAMARFEKVNSFDKDRSPFKFDQAHYGSVTEIIGRLQAYQIFIEQVERDPQLLTKYEAYLISQAKYGRDVLEFNDFFAQADLEKLGLIAEGNQDYHEMLEIFNPEDLRWLDFEYAKKQIFQHSNLQPEPEKSALPEVKFDAEEHFFRAVTSDGERFTFSMEPEDCTTAGGTPDLDKINTRAALEMKKNGLSGTIDNIKPISNPKNSDNSEDKEPPWWTYDRA